MTVPAGRLDGRGGNHAVTPYGRGAPSSRVRVLSWLERSQLEWVSHTYIGHRNADAAHLLRHPLTVAAAEREIRRLAIRRPDRLLLHREASPFTRGGTERRLLRSSTFSIYDFDDALQWDTGGSAVRRLFAKPLKAAAGVASADRVVAGNAVLADWAAEHCDDVVVVPSCVSLSDYEPKPAHELSDPPRLGWIGSPSEERQLELLEAPLFEVHRRTGARVDLIGTLEPTLGPLERLIDRRAWSEQAQRNAVKSFDVGLMPLRDAPYERGKCGYKLLQYSAVGVPSVASPVGVNRDIQRLTGMPAPDSASEWLDALLQLLEAPASTRRALGESARRTVHERYSYEAWLPRWEAAVGDG